MKTTFKTLLLSTISVVAVAGAASAQDAGGTVMNILDGAEPGKVSVAGITVYGTFDVGMAYSSHASNRDTVGSNYLGMPYNIAKMSDRSVFTYQNNALSQSALGVKGNQALKDLLGMDSLKGWSVGFDAAINFDPLYGDLADVCHAVTKNNGSPTTPTQFFGADGSRCGQLFSGDARAFFKNDVLGELSFGRQLTLLGSTIGAADPVAGSYAFSLLAFSGTNGAGAGITEQSRWNNSLKYTNTIGPVRVGAMYRFEGGGQGGRGWGLSAGIDVPFVKGLSIDGAYINEENAIVAAAASAAQCTAYGYSATACQNSNLLAATVSNNDGWTLTAKYKFDDTTFLKGFTVLGGYERYSYSNASGKLDNFSTIGGYQLVNIPGSTNGINYTAYATDKNVDVWWLGAKYAVTPKLTLAGGYYNVHQNAFVASGATGVTSTCAQASTAAAASSGGKPVVKIGANCSGDNDFYSIMGDYQLTKRLDLYAGFSWSDVSGGLSSGFLHTNEWNFASGVRFRF